MQFPFFSKQERQSKIFFGLFLKEKEGIGIAIKMVDSRLVLVDEEKFSYSNSWDNLTEDVDELILKLEGRTKVHLDETIFFVYSHFIDEKSKEIKKMYLHTVKNLVKKLELKALGYIECYEAVVNYLEKKEELPLTAVLIELNSADLSVFIYKRGTLAYSKIIAHTDNLIDDLVMCFQEVKGKFLLPSRIILYNSKDLEDEATQIVTHRWSEELFIQLPRVQIVKEHEIIQGLLSVFGEQFSKKKTNVEFEEKKSPQNVLGFVIGEEIGEKTFDSNRAAKPSMQISFSFMRQGLSSFIDKLSLIPRIVSKKLIILLGLAFVVIGLFLNELLLHKAKLTIFLPSQTIKKDVGLTERDVTLKTFTKTFEFSESQNTTGKKEVGEKARGTVTVHNFDDKEKAFSKGIILDSAGIKFILDQEVKVASASVVTINGGLVKQPGKTKTNATAQLIGPQANLSSGKQFKIEDFPTGLYFAINESSLTGGTKKDLKTVAKKDADDLKNKIIEKAKRQKVDLQKENMANVKIIDELTKASFTDTKFNKEIGEEASLLTLEAKVKETIYFYQTDELDSYLAKILSDSLQKGFTLQKDKLTYEISKIEQQDNKTNIQIKAQGKSLQEIAKKDVVKLVKGRNKNSLENLLKNSFNAEGFELEIEPELPVFGNMMPFFEKNITLKISSL